MADLSTSDHLGKRPRFISYMVYTMVVTDCHDNRFNFALGNVNGLGNVINLLQMDIFQPNCILFTLSTNIYHQNRGNLAIWHKFTNTATTLTHLQGSLCYNLRIFYWICNFQLCTYICVRLGDIYEPDRLWLINEFKAEKGVYTSKPVICTNHIHRDYNIVDLLAHLIRSDSDKHMWNQFI